MRFITNFGGWGGGGGGGHYSPKFTVLCNFIRFWETLRYNLKILLMFFLPLMSLHAEFLANKKLGI